MLMQLRHTVEMRVDSKTEMFNFLVLAMPEGF